jgi:hypothetical protein
VSKGHSLIKIQKISSKLFWFNLKEQTACWIVANKVKPFFKKNINLMVLTLV